MVYIDQPAGAGFSPPPSTVQNEIDVAHQFNDFWKRFIDTFDMQGYDIFLTGESYAGQYIPYIASDMLDRNDSTYFNLNGIQINDPSINEDNIMIEGKTLPLSMNFLTFYSPRRPCVESLLQCLQPERHHHEGRQRACREVRL